jgi:lipid II:glycine glycyltransferase (peptidoglycan interpeptide bridge formation enzyme)
VTGVDHGGGDGTRAPIPVVADAETMPAGWDRLVVEAPGGSVLQGGAQAAHRAGQGWGPRFLTFADGRGAMVLTRRRPPIPGFLAYAPRGPITAGDPPAEVARRVLGLADWLRREGATVLAADPALAASTTYAGILEAAGFHEVEEVQAERHRMVLTWPAGGTAASVLAGVSKTTRQRIRAAERGGTVVSTATDETALERFAELYAATARRLAFWVGDVGAAAAWWRRCIDAGQGLLLVARNDDRMVGGLFLYRQGGEYATAYSADDAATRRDLPGTMHLLRWRAIELAIEHGDGTIDLGGVDVPGARRIPEPGEATYGLYEHKRSFGASWVACAAAHEIVLRPWIHRASGMARSLRRRRATQRPPS